jgi:hypothetical protein
VLGAVTALMAALLTGLGAAGTAQAATVDTSAWYVLVNRGSGKALDVSGATTAGPCGWGLVQFTFDDWSQAALRVADLPRRTSLSPAVTTSPSPAAPGPQRWGRLHPPALADEPAHPGQLPLLTA